MVLAALGFALQIYCDFSGYTDIARGAARLMGFNLMLNFNLPYFAKNPQDFWRRWHISLSTWLRDYLYVSLGDEGLAHVDGHGKLVRVTSADGRPSQVVQTMFCDREGNLWAGYHRGGLVQLRKQTFQSITRTEGLHDTLVTSVTEDKSGTIWLGATTR